LEKFCRAGQATDDNMAHAHCMLDNLGYEYTHRLCNSYCFNSATLVARTRLNVTLYVHCVFCWDLVIIHAPLYATVLLRRCHCLCG